MLFNFFDYLDFNSILPTKGQKLIKLFTTVAAVNITRPIEETVSKLVYEKKLNKATAKKETEAKKTIELQKSMERYVKEKSSTKRATKSIKNIPVVSAKPPPAPIKDDPTGERERITLIMFYKQRFISNDFLTSLFLKKKTNGLLFFQKNKQH